MGLGGAPLVAPQGPHELALLLHGRVHHAPGGDQQGPPLVLRQLGQQGPVGHHRLEQLGAAPQLVGRRGRGRGVVARVVHGGGV